MSYRIDYSPCPQVPSPQRGSARPWLLTAGAFMLFCVLVHDFWQPGADLLGRLLLGEGHQELLSALERTLVSSRQGIPLREAAVGAFRELVHGG